MLEGEVEVLYMNEIHLVESARGKGLGKLMMQLLELLAAKSRMKYVMATVVKTGPAADGCARHRCCAARWRCYLSPLCRSHLTWRR